MIGSNRDEARNSALAMYPAAIISSLEFVLTAEPKNLSRTPAENVARDTTKFGDGSMPFSGDFQFYREDHDGSWSHKPGNSEAKRVDDPERNYELMPTAE